MKFNLFSYIGRAVVCLAILGLSVMLMPKQSRADVYINSLEIEIAKTTDFPHRILGGGAMDLVINGQVAKSLIMETELAPRTAIQFLYDNQSIGDPNDPSTWSSRGIMGIVGTEDWAFYADIFRGRLYEKEDGTIMGNILGDSQYPALAVSAFKNPDTNMTIVNFLMFDNEADLREAFLRLDRFDLDFYDNDTKWGEFKFKEYEDVSMIDLRNQIITEARADKFRLDVSNQIENGIFLAFSGDRKTREVFINNPSSGKLGVVVQNRGAGREGLQ